MWVKIVSPVHFALSIYVNRNFLRLVGLQGEEGAGQGKSFCQSSVDTDRVTVST